MSSTAILLHLLLLSFTPGAMIARAPDLPQNIWIHPDLRATVARLWESSPTFRAQVQRIGEQRLYLVNVTIDPKLSVDRWCRAQCVMRVYTSGLVIASVTVPDSPRLNTELIPHEFEHVIERIDGVNLRNAALTSGSGAYALGDGRIETERARRVGRRAHQETQARTTMVASKR